MLSAVIVFPFGELSGARCASTGDVIGSAKYAQSSAQHAERMERTDALVRRRPVDLVDDDDLERSAAGLEAQAELLL
jgi:hypothetical protein